MLDAFNKWEPGTAGRLAFEQRDGYMSALATLSGAPDVPEPEDENGIQGITPEKKEQIRQMIERSGGEVPINQVLGMLQNGTR